MRRRAPFSCFFLAELFVGSQRGAVTSTVTAACAVPRGGRRCQGQHVCLAAQGLR